jgi:hypothetical protein
MLLAPDGFKINRFHAVIIPKRKGKVYFCGNREADVRLLLYGRKGYVLRNPGKQGEINSPF